jgi:hypothetical protein
MSILTFINMAIQMRISLNLTSLTVIVLLISCDSDNQIKPVAPAERILGKWELTEIGNWPDMQPVPASGYFEFRENGTVRFFDYDDLEYTSLRQYSINDFIYTECYYPEPDLKIEINSEYQFYRGTDFTKKLRLDFIDLTPIFKTSIYTKI